jgi:hypothetical protein
MICDTCDKDIQESVWKKQCLDCFKLQYKKCLLCCKKKKNKYMFCYDCNTNKREECNWVLKDKISDELYDAYTYNNFNETKWCKGCQHVQIPKSLKWKEYCSNCWFFKNF